ncbi:CYFA0S04e04940g1_1 [Cyberlindnera fabianii]|uniref:DNA helicase n=1 Tax=Cyberlindnera fabianii TaxID=36022 RepID=A0A061AZI6_CYBFA|nr:CYFA0S04e04940g1_1 [Cyberlindnera fabianii]
MSHKKLSEKFLRCIELERAADVQQTTALLNSLPQKKLAAKGLAIINLSTENVRTGLGGRTIVELKNDLSFHDSDTIDSGDIRTGDIVKIDRAGAGARAAGTSDPSASKKKTSKASKDDKDQSNADSACEGVITRVSQTSVVVTIDENHEEKVLNIISDRLWIVKISNSITYKRMESTMRKLSEIETPNYLMQLLLNDATYVPPSDTQLETSYKVMKFHNDHLNNSQKHAINFAMNSPISIIHGPPGTGKTYTLIETIRQLIDRGERVLVCGPSNISVDTILERLNGLVPGDQLLRIGHPARLLSSNLQHCLDIVSTTSDGGQLVADIKKEIDDSMKKIKKTRTYKEKKAIWSDIKDLKRELRQREKRVTDELILQAKVVVSTLHGSSSRPLTNLYATHPGTRIFDTIIIDEVSQSLEPQCWIPLITHEKSQVKKLILAGDNQQLPPTIKLDNDAQVKKILETTIFDRLVSQYGDVFKRLLNIQYRMNKQIMTFSSDSLYAAKLLADESVENILLFDLDNVEKNDETEVPIIWYDTQGGDYPEKDSADSNEVVSSKYNEMEAYVVVNHIKKLLDSGVETKHIGVIAPYNAQVSLLKSLIHKEYADIEISTVDGFQGREKEIIIFTLVRSNDEREVGFLSEQRRLNVAITRPKRQLCVVGDMETISAGSKFLKSWVDWCEDNVEIVYPDIDEVLQGF